MTEHDSSGREVWQQELVAALRRDAGEPEPCATPTAATPAKLEVLAFELNGETYAVDIQEVAEILLAHTPTPVPRAPSFVLGVVTRRGSVLPVIELGQRLGLSPAEPSKKARIVVLKDGEERMGFRVGAVRGVLRFSPGEVEAGGFATAVEPRFVKGMGYDPGGNLVSVLVGESLCDFSLDDPESRACAAAQCDIGGVAHPLDLEAGRMPNRPVAVVGSGVERSLEMEDLQTPEVNFVDLQVGAAEGGKGAWAPEPQSPSAAAALVYPGQTAGSASDRAR